MVQTPRDPWVTASMLVSFVCAYDIVLALSHITTCVLFRRPINPVDRVWDFRETNFSSWAGVNMFSVQIFTALACIPLQVVLIRRAKLVLDFGLTVQASHLLFTWLYSNRLPTTTAWWATWLICNTIIVFGGEYACMSIELKPINFGPDSDATTNGETGQGDTSMDVHRISHSHAHESEDIELQERDKLLEEGNGRG